MKPASLAAIAALACASPACASPPAPGADLQLERVVMLMRHSVRPPTKPTVTPPGWAAEAWPAWTTPLGELTPHGAAGARLMGVYDREALSARGLFPAKGCPQPGDIAVSASGKSRSIETARNYAEAMFPGCGVKVEHPPDETNDPVFHPLESGATIDGARALAATRARLPAGGLAAVQAAHADDFAVLQRILGRPTQCAVPSCNLVDIPSELEGKAQDSPDLEGALGVASTVASTLMLSYVEGKPMSEVGWGRATKSDLTQLLTFHTTKFQWEARTPYVAERAAAPIARRVLEALDGAPGTGKLTLLVGHDTNIAQLGGMLDLHWQVADYPPDDPPPGGVLGFELVRDASGARFVRAFYEAQSMDQLRSLAPLTAEAPPSHAYLPIPGCTTLASEPCPLARFEAIVQRKLDHPAP
jgi:4-phytase/acid phosphatase